MREFMKGQHFVFWRIANGFILMPKYDERAFVDDGDVYSFKDLHEMYAWLDKFYAEAEEGKSQRKEKL